MRMQTKQIQIKNYSNHLQRLANIRLHSLSSHRFNKPYLPKIKNNKKSSLHKCLTQTINPKTHLYHLSPHTLPLISLTQRELVSKSLISQKIPLRQAQVLLQNYLLGKRIMQSKSCIKMIRFEKDYEKHQKYSHLRSQSKHNQIKLSQSRLLKFKQFENSRKGKLSSLNIFEKGIGRYKFILKIKSLQRVHRKQKIGILYNLILKIGKKSYSYRHLSSQTLLQNHSFYFHKKDLQFPTFLFVQLSEILQNDSIKIGNFTIDLNDLYNKISIISKSDQFQFQRQEIQGITTARSELLVGTISFKYTVIKRNK